MEANANVKYALAALSTSDTLSSCHNHPSPAYFLGPTKAIATAEHFSGFCLAASASAQAQSVMSMRCGLFLLVFCLLPEAFSIQITFFPYIHD
jgi:hypothetical protein